jgi:hypothetical protein
MSSTERPDEPASTGDDTMAFQRFYRGDETSAAPPKQGFVYRVLIGWWRRPR